ILAAVGSAVGMANVWGFPAKMGSNGGAAFLVAYLIFIALFSVVGLSAEYAIGRYSRTGTLGSYRAAWATRNKQLGQAGGLLGWLPLAGSMCIAIGYAIIIAYVLKAFFCSITGELMAVDTTTWFGTFSSAEYSVIPFHIIVVVATLLTLVFGASSIEKSNKIMMPLFFVIFAILAIRVHSRICPPRRFPKSAHG
ncbi:MAG: sodium-dependent transporter, partial [Clostridia bacterium]|nr:sodium-dependent transporter [Clostridia bacterium]